MTTATGRTLIRIVMFVDISGSSRLYKELGDTAAHKRVRGCLKLLSQTVERHDGRTIKNVGDGLMCEFTDADHALLAAAEMQVAMADQEEDVQPKLTIHVGCHLGHVIETSGDLFGDTVNIAARMTTIAGAGQIIATLAAVERLSPELHQYVRPLDSVSLKGRSDPVSVFDYLWRTPHDVTMVGAPAARAGRSRLRVTCGDREVWVDGSGPGVIVLGRHSGCELTVNDPEASRQHATIELRGDKFVLVDHSSNGTYVAWESVNETRVKREEMILPPRGLIGLGSSTLAPNVTLVKFSAES